MNVALKVALIVCGLPALAAAQNTKGGRGTAEPWDMEPYSGDVYETITRAEWQAFAAEIVKLRDVVNSAPTLQARVGFDLRPMGNVSELSKAGQPMGGKYWFQTFLLPRWRGQHSFVSFTFEINPPLTSLNRAQLVGREGDIPFWLEPRASGYVDGFPQYGGSSNRITVVTTRKEPWVIPVSQERLLRAKIADARKDVDSWQSRTNDPTALERTRASYAQGLKSIEEQYQRMLKTDPAAAEAFKTKQLKDLERAYAHTERMFGNESAELKQRQQIFDQRRERLNLLESRLAAMSAGERAAQARHCITVPASITPCGADMGRPIVTPNPNFYDRTLPRSAMQLIMVHSGAELPPTKAMIDALYDEFDFVRIAALLR